MHREVYKKFWQWSDACLDYAMINGNLHTVFGWTILTESHSNHRSLRNFPMQANGAEILRLAIIMAINAGIKVCAPVHDALLIEAPLKRIDQAIIETQEIMAEASSIVLNGFRLNSDVHAIHYPDRYFDERGEKMWDTVWELIQNLEKEDESVEQQGWSKI